MCLVRSELARKTRRGISRRQINFTLGTGVISSIIANGLTNIAYRILSVPTGGHIINAVGRATGVSIVSGVGGIVAPLEIRVQDVIRVGDR